MSTWNPHLHQLRVVIYAADRVPPFNPLSSIRKNMVAVPYLREVKKTDRFFIRFLAVFLNFSLCFKIGGIRFSGFSFFACWGGSDFQGNPTRFHLKQIGAKRTPPRMSNRKCRSPVWDQTIIFEDGLLDQF